DRGMPIVIERPDSDSARALTQVAKAIAGKVSVLALR
ncbi:MAG: sodium:proton antiporter, partial [Cyanobacteria bacterium P01_F01_bin.3]